MNSKLINQIRLKKPKTSLDADYGNSRKAAIHLHCAECMGGAMDEVSKCTATTCALWPYRPGPSKMVTDRPVGIVPAKEIHEKKLSKRKKHKPGRPKSEERRRSFSIDDIANFDY